MLHKLIDQYISRLTKDDINSFGIKNGIELNDDALNLIYNYVKNDYKTIIFGNPKPIFDNIKQNVDETTYQKIENLYLTFYDKYKNYL